MKSTPGLDFIEAKCWVHYNLYFAQYFCTSKNFSNVWHRAQNVSAPTFTHYEKWPIGWMAISALRCTFKKLFEVKNIGVGRKLMRSYWPQAKFHLKLDLNHLLIDFFDPKSKSKSSRLSWFQQLKKDRKVWNWSFFN